MGRRNDHSREQQREMAIAAAELLLIREGLSGFSMRKVAQAIGYTVGQLYLLFRNQDELFVVLNERTADGLYARLSDAAEQADDTRAALFAVARLYVEFAQQHPHRWQLLFEHRLPAGEMPPAANIRKVERLFGLIEKFLPPDAADSERREAAAALWCGVHGVAVLAVSGKLSWSGIDDYAQLSESLVERFLS